ncbi:MAG: hypothetical protein ABSH31_07650 [Bryobacteraceae bacterium]|jgi:hypothetical protein
MLEFANAAFKFQIAISSFGAQRLLGVLPMSDSGPVRGFQETFYKAGEAATKEFKTNTALFGAFQFGDKAQSALASLAADVLSLKVLSPSYIREMAAGIAHGSKDAVGSVITEEARGLLKQQFSNTFDVIGYVNHVDAPKHLTDGTYPLEAMIEKCYSHGDYPALWYVEGLGERYAEAYMAGGKEIRDLLTSGKAAEADPKIQTMMHAGMGITFAKHAVANLTPWSTDAEFRDALTLFLKLVRNNSILGYEGAALESLGLVTRTWNGQLVSKISTHVRGIDADAFEFFWHGAGRAMYFSPMYMIPGLSPWDAADNEPPNDVARRNARAGVAWAFTIVNVRQPEIAAHFLRYKAEQIAGNDAYTDGAYSTLIMAGDMVPGHRYVSAFGRYQPNAADPESVAAWNKHLGADVEAKVDHFRSALKAHKKLGEVFRYHHLPHFVADLKG